MQLLASFAGDMILKIEKTQPKQLLELINEFSKIVGYTINI